MKTAFLTCRTDRSVLFSYQLSRLTRTRNSYDFHQTWNNRFKTVQNPFNVRSMWKMVIFAQKLFLPEGVANWILPSLLVLTIIWKQFHDPGINFVECHHFGARLLNRHCNKTYVGVWWFCMTVVSSWCCRTERIFRFLVVIP